MKTGLVSIYPNPKTKHKIRYHHHHHHHHHQNSRYTIGTTEQKKYDRSMETIYGTQGQYRVHAFDHDGYQGIRDSDELYDDEIARNNGTHHYSKKSKAVTAKKFRGQKRVPDLKPKEYRRSIYPNTTPSPPSQLFLYSSPKKKESPQTPSPFARQKRSMPKWVKDDIERGEYRMDS